MAASGPKGRKQTRDADTIRLRYSSHAVQLWPNKRWRGRTEYADRALSTQQKSAKRDADEDKRGGNVCAVDAASDIAIGRQFGTRLDGFGDEVLTGEVEAKEAYCRIDAVDAFADRQPLLLIR